jgi:hypothetical protein
MRNFLLTHLCHFRFFFKVWGFIIQRHMCFCEFCIHSFYVLNLGIRSSFSHAHGIAQSYTTVHQSISMFGRAFVGADFVRGKALVRGELFQLYTLPKGEARDRAAGFSISSRDDACRIANPREVPSESRLDLHAHRVRHSRSWGHLGSASSVPILTYANLSATAKRPLHWQVMHVCRSARSLLLPSCVRLGINPWQTRSGTLVIDKREQIRSCLRR